MRIELPRYLRLNNRHKPGTIEDRLHHSREIIHSLKAKSNAKRSIPERAADWMTGTFGTFGFLVFNVLVMAGWILINTDNLPGVGIFDPFPFSLLTTILSIEAIILAIFVLISQNRAAKVDDLREEIDLQVNIIGEQEITKVLELVKLLAEKEGIDLSGDTELSNMLQPTDTDKIEKILERQL